MIARLVLVALVAVSASACALQRERLSEIGSGPRLSPVEDPSVIYGGQPVLMPMPVAAHAGDASANSLWKTGARTFFGDPRASAIGDILTVEIAIQDKASVSNTTNRSRSSSEDADLNAFLGLENSLGQLLPGGFDPSAAVDLSSSASASGQGSVDRSETINLTVAAVITQVLPNGNLVIAGRQQVRINHEMRELLITGVARPEDITSENTIAHTKIAEARISYGGRGVISDVQSPRYGQQAAEILLPF